MEESKVKTAEELTLTECMDKIASIEILAVTSNHHWTDWADWHRYLRPSTGQSFKAFREAAEMYADQFQSHITKLEADKKQQLELIASLGLSVSELMTENAKLKEYSNTQAALQLEARNKELERSLKKIKNANYITGLCGVDNCMYDKQICVIREIAEQALNKK